MSKQSDTTTPKNNPPADRWWGIWIEGRGWLTSNGVVLYFPAQPIAQAQCDVMKNPSASVKEF